MSKLIQFEDQISSLHRAIWNEINGLLDQENISVDGSFEVDNKYHFDLVDRYSASREDGKVIFDFGDCNVEDLLLCYEVLSNTIANKKKREKIS